VEANAEDVGITKTGACKWFQVMSFFRQIETQHLAKTLSTKSLLIDL
jgi:hypothetical protein